MNYQDPLREPARARAREARLHRGMFLLPSLFTSVNIGAGYFSILQTIAAISGNTQSHLDLAAIAILFAIPFDALDGRIARMTNTCSDFGKELDSLADAITFGVAPSLLAFVWGFQFLPDTVNPHLRQHLMQAGSFVCFLFLLSGASRLARFNIAHDPQPRNPGLPGRKYFVGMPIPAAAGLLAATIHLCYGIPVAYWWISVPWLLMVALTGFLMVSTWRFWSGKEINFSRSHPFQMLVLMAIVIYMMLRYSNVVLFLMALTYMFSGIWARAAYGWGRRRRRRPQEAQAAAPDALADPLEEETEKRDSLRYL
ncbi:MAG TPA: phosphatidylcholine/phosphatidylserine synthase [Terracidiphilus sp.]|nr:phosphatidylcholine/phosphatidylserine synthase [Terracidiphilus sp.]